MSLSVYFTRSYRTGRLYRVVHLGMLYSIDKPISSKYMTNIVTKNNVRKETVYFSLQFTVYHWASRGRTQELEAETGEEHRLLV